MDTKLIVPNNYQPTLNLKQTEIAIKTIKDYFERKLAKKLNLLRVSAPLFVRTNTGLNDNLSGVERPVIFDMKNDSDSNIEIVHSLAKWKRMALKRYNFKIGEGIYTDMDAIRRDEEFDNTHSIYVDQWDWEKIIDKKERNQEKLKEIVNLIYGICKDTEEYICDLYDHIEPILPEEIYFISSKELEGLYPDLSPESRERKIAKEKKAVFIMEIGRNLESGEPHGMRSPDYDDWDLNGDIIFWNPVLNSEFEISSMGIRVDKESLKEQLKLSNCEDRKTLEYHKLLLQDKLPLTVGGGIGQSRLCMFFLRKAHIGEVQSSIWPKWMIEDCNKKNIILL
ncbi:aspartate--ammonia ligase [Senegalia massiliensis]|uniref:aspartate--ammonia ligase n=1 Tax=Senegalia massiliensis TaxID=1720316 RepID=UPI00102F7C10|nr:aspartate--ammonia ligase [Senegalia massiliensis]